MRCKINRHSLQYLAFIWPVVTQQWSFPPILSPWNARFSLLVPGKYSYALRQQPSWCVPPYFQQIVYASPLRTCEDLSETERGPFMWQCRSGINDTDNSRGCLDVKFSSKPHITSDVDKKTSQGCLAVESNNKQHITSKLDYWPFIEMLVGCCFQQDPQPGMSDVPLLSGISGLSFDSPFLSPLLFFFSA